MAENSENSNSAAAQSSTTDENSVVTITYTDKDGNIVGKAEVDGDQLSGTVAKAFDEVFQAQGGGVPVVRADDTDVSENQVNDFTISVVIIIALFMCFGAIAVGQLLKSFERR